MNARPIRALVTSVLVASLAACDANPSNPALGALEIQTSAPTVAQELTTADDWIIKFDHFLVHVTAVNVAGDDKVLAASATPQIIDQAAPASKSLLAATVRVARPWEDVSFEIGPAAAGTAPAIADPVTAEQRDMMQKEGLSFYIEAKVIKADVTKTLKWGFTTDTLHGQCQEKQNGVVVRGLVVPPDGKSITTLTMDGSVLFSDDLTKPGAAFRADAITAADADNDGNVTMEELQAVTLDDARASGGTYDVAARTDIGDLGAFIAELTRSTVTSFRATGACTAEPVVAK